MYGTTKLQTPRVLPIVLAFAAAWSAPTSFADELEWPRTFTVPEAEIVMYQPQLETFDGNKLTARAAVSVKRKGAEEPVFGAVWLSTRTATDRDERLVTLSDLDITDVKFPNADPERVKKLETILEAHLPSESIELSLDRLLTMLDLVEKEKAAADALHTTPPKFILVKYPAALVTIDGEPRLIKVDNSSLMRVVNTPSLIVFDPGSKTYYLYGGTEWLAATDILGPWNTAGTVPKDAEALIPKEEDAEDPESAPEAPSPADTRMPRVFVATEPTELIHTTGEPEFGTIRGTNLLYVSNTESDVFLTIDPQQIYILTSGRWYTAPSKDGPWSYVPSEELPEDFSRIPPGSDKGHVLASVAGTDEAHDAVLETQIPQTATVKRGIVELKVVYDGEPKFEKIEGTEMFYAVNSAFSVIRIGGRYYCCSEGVWYESGTPLGPWSVSTSVPSVVYTIPPSCPIYNVKYVYVYDSTPDIVYVGYTPGYVGCYVYGGTVVYGTGYYYHGWYHKVYYPRPTTWGFAARYNPYTGNWAFGIGYRGPYGGIAVGGIHVGHRHGHGWWGGGGFRYTRANINRNIYRRSRHPANPRGAFNRRGPLDARGPMNRRSPSDTLSRRSNPRNPVNPRGPVDRRGAIDPRSPRTGTSRANNVFADKKGNVYRQSFNGWQQRNNKGWAAASPSRRSTPRSTPGRSANTGVHRDLNRQHQARSRGTHRTNNFQRSRSSGGMRGGMRGGRRGGRR